jgi:TRAP-type C4-dicarboxylate transport system substrate-binding protein
MPLPFYSKCSEGCEIYNRLIHTSPEIQQEFKKYGVRGLAGLTTGQYDVFTVKKPVKSPDHLKGLKLKTGGGIYDQIARRYGIISVSMPAAETYEAMQRGVVEGMLMNFPSARSYRYNEIIKYITNGARLGGYPGAEIINEKTWEKLPQVIQKGILQAADEVAKRWGGYWDQMHIEIYPIKPEERAKWDAPLKGLEEEWIKEAEKKNLPGRKVFNDFLKISKEVMR